MKPVLQALLLADHVYQEKSGKHIIAGTFNRWRFITPGALPKKIVVDGEEKQVIPGGMQAGSPYVYVSLTEVRGEARCTLRYVGLEDNEALFQCSFTVRCDDPLQTVEIILPFPSLPNVAGVHAVELLCEEELLGMYRVIVEEIKDIGNDDTAES